MCVPVAADDRLVLPPQQLHDQARALAQADPADARRHGWVGRQAETGRPLEPAASPDSRSWCPWWGVCGAGDQQPDFVGSSKWIGSLEVGYYLDQELGVAWRNIFTSTGPELADKVSRGAAGLDEQRRPVCHPPAPLCRREEADHARTSAVTVSAGAGWRRRVSWPCTSRRMARPS